MEGLTPAGQVLSNALRANPNGPADVLRAWVKDQPAAIRDTVTSAIIDPLEAFNSRDARVLSQSLNCAHEKIGLNFPIMMSSKHTASTVVMASIFTAVVENVKGIKEHSDAKATSEKEIMNEIAPQIHDVRNVIPSKDGTLKEIAAQIDDVPNVAPLPTDPMDVSHSIHDFNEVSIDEPIDIPNLIAGMGFMGDENKNEEGDARPINDEKNEEFLNDNTAPNLTPQHNSDSMDVSLSMHDFNEDPQDEPMDITNSIVDLGIKGEEEKKDEKDTSETSEKEIKRRPSRNVSRPVNYAEFHVDFDVALESSEKKSAESRDKKIGSGYGGSSQIDPLKKEKNEMQCLECDFRSTVVGTYIGHLKTKHSTNLKLAGIILRCECGHEPQPFTHSRSCKFASFTVIRKGDGPIRRLVEPVSPECINCNESPKTTFEYTEHLMKHHKTTLRESGIYLNCSCGYRVEHHRSHMDDDKKCSAQEFTLHKLNDE